MILLPLVFVPLLYMLAVTVFNVLTAPMLRKAPSPKSTPKVSVLVPARNEEIHLRACLDGLRAQDWPNLEILVLDDNSIDDTWPIIMEAVVEDKRVRGLRGTEPPEGWLGKPWACQQLAYEATGDILIFTDADNEHAPNAVSATVGWMQSKRLQFLSAFPQQVVGTLGEKLIVPTVDLLVYTLLPLRLTLNINDSRMAAASGQWLAMTRDAYKRAGGHDAVKGDVVEDMALARKARTLGMRTLTLAGTDVVYGKMYGTFREVWEGFRKNLYGVAGGSPGILFGQLGLLAAATILPYALLLFSVRERTRNGAKNAVLLNLTIRALLAVKYRHPWMLVALHPVAMALLVANTLASLQATQGGTVRWKGRAIQMTSSGGRAV